MMTGIFVYCCNGWEFARRGCASAGIVACLFTLVPLRSSAEAPAAESSAPAAAPANSASFDEQFVAWKELLAELRILHARHQLVSASEKKNVEEQADAVLSKLVKQYETLKQTAIEKYQKAPAENPAIGQFLFHQTQGYIASDRPDLAIPLCQILIDGKYPNPQAKQFAADAAFNNNDFARALELAEEAVAKNPKDKVAAGMKERAAAELELWQAEEKIRAAEAQADNLPRVRLETSKGPVVIELFVNEAPKTAANFLSLVKKGFYDGTKFHRVIANFMAQGGDPNGNGMGGPGYTIPCECYQDNYRRHFRGSVSMAHAGKDTGGSQFFISFVPTDQLDGKHTVFGRVVEGMEAVSSLIRVEPSRSEIQPDKIVKATIVRDGSASENSSAPPDDADEKKREPAG